MFEENKKLEAKFQEFLQKEFPKTLFEADNKIVLEAMRSGFEAGALAGIDLFVEFYNEDDI